MPRASGRKDTTPVVTDDPYRCHSCGGPAKPNDPGTWREITGWVQSRTGGGAHGVRNQVPTGRYACRFCVEQAKKGLDREQQALL